MDELAEAGVDGARRDKMAELATVPLLIIDDLGMRKLPATAAADLLELVMRRYERVSTLLTSNRPVDDWGKLLVTAYLDIHHRGVLPSGTREPSLLGPAYVRDYPPGTPNRSLSDHRNRMGRGTACRVPSGAHR